MRSYLKQTKILNSSSRDILNNNFKKDAPTPHDGLSDAFFSQVSKNDPVHE